MKIKRWKKYSILEKKKVNFSQTLFVYYGCDNYCYLDGTRRIVPKNGKRLRPTHYPFRKKTIDVCNKVETRAQIKLKARATKNFLNRYIRNVDVFQETFLVQTIIQMIV